MATPKVQVKVAQVTRRLNILKKRGQSLQEPLTEIGEIVLSSVEKNFQDEGRYSTAGDWHGGTNRWDDLAESTKKQRAKRGKWPGKKLQQSQGGLANSFSSQVSGDQVEIGSNKIYAGIQHFGGQAGRGKKVTIPARPILVVQDEDIDDAMDVLGDHMEKP